jgi:chromosome segregation ATPase
MSDAFIDELQNKKQELTQILNSKKSDLSRLDAEQRKLGVLIEAEKHSSNSHDKKSKNHAPSKDTRTDIVKNEAKFKDQAKKLDDFRKEIHHLEDELKSVMHDLHVVGVA